MIDMVRNLCNIPGASSDEKRVREHIMAEISSFADEMKVDALGNLLVFKKGRCRPKNRVMFAAHMDEVGLIITYIEENGRLRFDTVGGITADALLGKIVRIGEKGIPGVIGTKPIHLQSDAEKDKLPGLSDLLIDIGADSRSQAEEYLKIADLAVFEENFCELADGTVVSKALDDRVGCAVLMELIKSELPYDCFFAFTVLEEVGTRGAAAAVHVLKPEIAVVLETTTAADIPEVSGSERVCAFGKGAVVSFADRGTLYDRELYELIREKAEQSGILTQTKTKIAGGNDSAAIHKAAGGVRTAAVSVPCRYLHSGVCMAKISDIEAVKNLAELLCSILPEV